MVETHQAICVVMDKVGIEKGLIFGAVSVILFFFVLLIGIRAINRLKSDDDKQQSY